MTPHSTTKSTPKGVWGKVLFLLRPQDKKRIIFLAFIMFIAAISEMVGLAAIHVFMQFLAAPEIINLPLIGPILSHVSQNERMVWVSSGLIGVFAIKLLIFYAVYAYMAWVVTQQHVTLSSRLFSAYQEAPQRWHLNRTSSEILRCLREDVAKIVNTILTPMLELILNSVVSIAILAYLLMTMPAIVLAGMLITVVGLLFVMRKTQSIIVNASAIQRREIREEIKAIQQGVGGLTEARILGKQKWFRDQYEKALKAFAEASRKQITLVKITPVVLEVLSVLSLMVVVSIIINTVNSPEEAMALGTLVAAAILRLKQTASKIAVATNKINAGSVFLPTVLGDITELESLTSPHKIQNAGPSLGVFKELKFNQISYCFSPSERPALNKLSFEMRAGEHVAIVGKTGSGKSTLINLILGLYTPQSGSILINDCNMIDSIKAWQSKIGYIPQSIYMLEDTIKANVAFGVEKEQIDVERVNEALKVAQFETFLNSLPDGLDTIIGEHGARLSGGQRQRIGVARALYSNPEILILDEATSALDVETEAKLLSAINNLPEPISILSITHRLETIRDFDLVLFLTGGQLAAQDNYEKLINTSEEFRNMALIKNGSDR